MTKQTSVEQQIKELSDKIKDLEDAIWNLHDVVVLDEVHFELDFPIDDSEYH